MGTRWWGGQLSPTGATIGHMSGIQSTSKATWVASFSKHRTTCTVNKNGIFLARKARKTCWVEHHRCLFLKLNGPQLSKCMLVLSKEEMAPRLPFFKKKEEECYNYLHRHASRGLDSKEGLYCTALACAERIKRNLEMCIYLNCSVELSLFWMKTEYSLNYFTRLSTFGNNMCIYNGFISVVNKVHIAMNASINVK